MRMRSIASALLFFSCGALGLRAQVTWYGATDLYWSTPSNWSPNDNNATLTSGTADVIFNNYSSVSSLVDQAYTINSLTVGNYAGTLSNSGGGTLNVISYFTDSSANAVLVEVPLSGTMALNVSGTGTLTLNVGTNSFANTYYGNTVVTAGALADASAYSFSYNSQLLVGLGGRVNVNFPEQVLSLSDYYAGSGGSVVIAQYATLFINGDYSPTFSGVISGLGNLEKDGSSSQILTGANTYTGTTVVGLGASLQLGDGITAGSLLSPSVSGSGSLVFDSPTTTSYSGVLSGALGVANWGGTTTLSGTNTYSGATSVLAGTLIAGSTSAFGGATGASAVTVSGTLDLNNYNNSIGTLNGSGSVTLGTATLTLLNSGTDFTGVISGSGGSVASNSAFAILAGANTYTGGTTISAGRLVALNTSGSALGSGAISISAGAILQVGNLMTSGGIGGGNISNNGTLNLEPAAAVTYSNPISGLGVINIYGGPTTLSGNNTYSGATNLYSVTVNAGSSTALGNGSDVTLTSSTLNLSGNNISVGSLASDSASAVHLGANTLTLTDSNESNFGGAMDGTGSLVLNGGGEFAILGSVAYTGGTTIGPSGYLSLGLNSSPGASMTGNVLDNGQFQFAPYSTDNYLFSGAITGTGLVRIVGAGIVTLENGGGNTYHGITDLVTSTLTDGAANAFSPNSSVIISSGGTLAVTHNETVADLEDGSGSGNVTLATGTTLTIGTGNAALSPFTGIISSPGGPAGITINTGSNSQGFGGENTYTGVTTINSGEIFISSSTVGAPGSIASGPIGTNTLVFAGNGELSSLGTTITLANAINLNGFNLDNDDATTNVLRLTGLISGSVPGSGGSITWCTPNGLALDNSNTFSGGVDMREGTLLLGSNTGAGAADMNGTSTITLETATLTADGTGMTLNIANPINITGTSQFGNYDNNNITLSGNITGITGSLTYAGGSTGHLTLTGSNTVSIDGYFTIASGTVNAGSNSAFGYFSNQVELTGGAGLNVMSGVTIGNPLAFTGSANGLSGDGTISSAVIAGGSTVINPSGSNGNGPGILTFSNASTNGLTLASGSAIHFDLYDANGAAGTGYGLISDTSLGGLAITAIPSSITFNIVTTDISGNAANALNFNPANPYSWTFATSTNPITGFNSADFNIITSGFTNNFAGGGFSISEVGNNLDLNFTPVPEPSTWALLGGGVLVLVPIALRRRRLRKA